MRLLLDARKSRLVPRAVAAVSAAAAAASVASACASDALSRFSPSDAGVDDSAVATAICPEVAPDAGATCSLPEGTTCDFGQCSSLLAVCTRGIWRFAANADARPPCPAEPPSVEAPCPACWPVEITCSYGSLDCKASDASVNTSVASCVGERWTLEVRPCRDAGTSIADAGADVQGDGGLDAD